MMKNRTLLLAILCISSALIFESCCKDKNGTGTGGGGTPVIIEQDIPFTYKADIAIPATGVVLFNAIQPGVYIEPFSVTFPTNTEAELANQGFTKDKILSIKGESMLARMIGGTVQNFDFMDTIRVYVADKNGNNKTLYAHRYDYPTGLNPVVMDMTNDDVKEIFRQDSAIIYFGGTKRDATSVLPAGSQIEFETKVIAKVNANKN